MIKLGNITAYTVQEIAEKFNISAETVRTYIKKGKLKACKMGTKYYVTEDNLKAYLEGIQPSRKEAGYE